MANMYITEYQTTALTPNNPTQAPMEPPITTQKVSFSGTAGSSATLNANTRLIRINCDGIASISVGVGVTATTNDPRLSLGVTEYRAVPKSSGFRVSAITNS